MTPAPTQPQAPRGLPVASLSGGLILALCFVLPAVKGCNEPVRPYEVPSAWGPSALGLFAALLAVLRLAGARLPRPLAALYWLVATAGGIGVGTFLVLLFREHHDPL